MPTKVDEWRLVCGDKPLRKRTPAFPPKKGGALSTGKRPASQSQAHCLASFFLAFPVWGYAKSVDLCFMPWPDHEGGHGDIEAISMAKMHGEPKLSRVDLGVTSIMSRPLGVKATHEEHLVG